MHLTLHCCNCPQRRDWYQLRSSGCMWLGGGRKEVLLRDAMKPGSWKWPGGFSETPKDLTPDELTRGMVKISASANGSGKPAGAGRNGGSGKAAGAGRDGGSGTETPSTRLEWKPKKPDLQVSGARANKVSHQGRACRSIHALWNPALSSRTMVFHMCFRHVSAIGNLRTPLELIDVVTRWAFICGSSIRRALKMNWLANYTLSALVAGGSSCAWHAACQ